MRVFFFLFFVFLIGLPIQASPLAITDPDADYPLLGHLEFFLDDTSQLTVDDVHNPQFSRFSELTKRQANIGFIHGTLWLRLRLKNELSSRSFPHWFLDLGTPHLRELDFYQWQNGKLIRNRTTGTQFPFDHREVKHRNWLLRFAVTEGESVILLRIKSQTAVNLNPTVQPPQRLFAKVNRENLLMGFLFGFFAVMLVYNAGVFVVTREGIFGIFSCLMIAAITYRLSMTGLGFRYFWPNHPGIIEFVIRISAGSTIALIGLFARSFLRTWEWKPWLDKSLLASSIGAVLIMMWPVFINAPLAASMVVFLPPGLACLGSFFAKQRKIPGANMFFWGWVLFFSCLIVGVFAVIGYAPQISIVYTWLDLGLFFLVMLTSFGLANRINEEKIQRVAANSRANTKAEFLANMSHEIRTPMNAIMGFSELALTSGCTQDDQKQYLRQIGRSSENLLGIINDVLDLSKIEAGKLAINISAFDVQSLCEDLVDFFSPQFEAKKITLNLILKKDKPTRLLGDSLRLNQILTNLLSNSLKFTKSGEVNLRVSYKKDKRLHIEVQDTGIGLSQVQIDKLFEPFTQADTSTTRIYGGTGLGLTITKQLTDLMAGEIWLESKPDVGTTFFVTLPMGVAEKVARRPQPNHPVANKTIGLDSCRVLLVEDNPVNQLLATTLLKRAGSIYTLAENGQEAVTAVQNEVFDLVLMDIQMPIMDGFEATRQIRQIYESDKLPIIGLTANAMVQDKEACMAVGMNDFVAKPFKAETLYSAMHRWHSGA